jgi:hypothetical protein
MDSGGDEGEEGRDDGDQLVHHRVHSITGEWRVAQTNLR